MVWWEKAPAEWFTGPLHVCRRVLGGIMGLSAGLRKRSFLQGVPGVRQLLDPANAYIQG